jgi:mono/diheme cytochrome c family protein
MRRLTLLALALTAVFSAAPAQAGDVFNGRRLYTEHCTRCHGNDGIPLLPGTPDLSRGQGLLAPDQILLRSLRFGKGLMPGFESVIRGREMFDVLVYVRSLHR